MRINGRRRLAAILTVARLLSCQTLQAQGGPTVIWQTDIVGNGPDWTSANASLAVTVDKNDNVVAAGHTGNTVDGFAVTSFAVSKLDGATGIELWRYTFTGTSYDFNEARAVAVDATGDVVAAGVTTDDNSSRNFRVVKLDGATGRERWHYLLNPGPMFSLDEARALTLGPDGNVLAAGSGANGQFVVVKIDNSSGVELWRYTLSRFSGLNEAEAVAVDGQGNILAAGFTKDPPFYDLTVVKLDGSTGAALWRQFIRGWVTDCGFNPCFNVSNAVAVDANADVLAAGFTQNRIGGNADFTVLKLKGSTGIEQWRHVAVGASTSYPDEARALATTSDGHVIACGFVTTTTGETRQSFTVVNLDGSLGGQLWRRDINVGARANNQGRAVAVDGNNNIAAAARTSESAGWTFTVVKLQGATGADVWRYDLRGTGNIGQANDANAVTFTTTGDVVGSGDIDNRDQGHGVVEFAVVRLAK